MDIFSQEVGGWRWTRHHRQIGQREEGRKSVTKHQTTQQAGCCGESAAWPHLSREIKFSGTNGCRETIFPFFSWLQVVVVFVTLLTDRASTIPNNIRGCQSGTTWSAGQENIRGTSTKKAPTRAWKQNKTKTKKFIRSRNWFPMDGVYHRESAGTRPAVLRVVRVTGYCFLTTGNSEDQFIHALLIFYSHTALLVAGFYGCWPYSV